MMKRSTSALAVLAALLVLSSCTGDGGTAEAGPSAGATAVNYEEYDSAYADWAPRYVDCVNDAGGRAVLLSDGIDYPTVSGREEWQGLDALCVESVGGPPEPPPLTDEFLTGLYRGYVIQAECLRNAGYEVSQPPSEQAWVENYGGESWSPFSELLADGGDLVTLERQCPQPDPREAERLGREGG